LKRRDSLEKMGQSCTGRLDLSALTVTIFSIIVQMQSCGLEFTIQTYNLVLYLKQLSYSRVMTK
jgi:hypothetical protein